MITDAGTVLTAEAVRDALDVLYLQHDIVTATALAVYLGIPLRIANGCLYAVSEDEGQDNEWERAITKAA